MKYSESYVAKKIIIKSNSYLKIAIGIFISIMILIATAGVFYINQYFQLDKNFLNNETVHTIKVSYAEEGSKCIPLDEEKIESIKDIISQYISDDKFSLIPVYTTCTGIVNQDGEMIKVFGVDDKDCRIVGNCPLENDTMYFEKFDAKTINMNITNYEITNDGGLIGKDNTELKLKCKEGVSRHSPILIFNPIDTETLLFGFVNVDTFLNIAKLLTNTDAKGIGEISNNGLIELSGIYVYVDDLVEVEQVASILNDSGFSSQCTFDAFDSFGDSFQDTIKIVLILGGVIFLISLIQLLLAFNSYYKMQQKDMGILKYYGFSTKRIQRIYVKGLNTLFLAGLVFFCIYILILSIATRIIIHMDIVIVFLAAIVIMMLALRWFIKKMIICKYSKRNILFLLKNSKEVE